MDVGQTAIAPATRHAAVSGLSDRLSYMLIEDGTLALAEASYGVIFSKDAIMHVADKEALYADFLRILRPGGSFVASDWYRGEAPVSDEMIAYVDSARLTLALDTLEGTGQTLRQVGIVDVETRDRTAWYRELAGDELLQAQGSDRANPRCGFDRS